MKRMMLVFTFVVALGLVFGSGLSAKMIRMRKDLLRVRTSPLIDKMPRVIRPTAQ